MPNALPRKRFVVPGVGLALGAGLLFSESVLIVHDFLGSFGGGGVWRQLLGCAVSYAALGALVDLLVQAVAPARFRRSRLVRGIPILLVAFAAQRTFGLATVAAYATVPLSAVFAYAASVRWGRPMAAGFAALALMPALPPVHVPEATAASGPAAAGPSVLVVVMDTVRRDHVSAYGYARKTTPNFDALAARGVRFDRAYASSCWSVPSHASLFTGLLATKHGADFEHFFLDEGVDTVAELFAKNGWETAGFSGNPYIAAGTGMSRGFETFDESWRPHVMRRWLVGLQFASRLFDGIHDKGGSHVVGNFKAWLAKRDGKRPFFAFANLLEAHAPYQDSQLAGKFSDPKLTRDDLERIGDVSHEAQWLGTKPAAATIPATLDLLDGATASADQYLGEILDAVGPNTIVVVASDHGDLVGEHGLWGHMTSLYQTLIHVPLAIAGPGIPEGKVIGDPVSLMDVMPTLLDYAGIASPPTDGIDIRPLIEGRVAMPDRIVRAQHFRTTVATNLWALNRSPAELKSIRARRAAAIGEIFKRIVAEDGEDLGFNIVQDPGELHPFPGADTGLTVEVPKPPPRRGPEHDLDPAQIDALKSLGYMR